MNKVYKSLCIGFVREDSWKKKWQHFSLYMFIVVNIKGNESFTQTEKLKKWENSSRARDVIKNCNLTAIPEEDNKRAERHQKSN